MVARNVLQKDDGIWQGELTWGLGELGRRLATACRETCLVLVGPVVLIPVAKDKLESQEISS